MVPILLTLFLVLSFGEQIRGELSRLQKDLRRTVSVAFDRNGDGVVQISEAALGIQTAFDGHSPRPPSTKNRDCAKVIFHSTEASFVLDCIANFAERKRAQGIEGPLDIEEALASLKPPRATNIPPPGGMLCDDLIEFASHPRALCEQFRFGPSNSYSGYCETSCYQYYQESNKNQESPQEEPSGPGGGLTKPLGGTSSSSSSSTTTTTTALMIPVLLTSDWHMEPWYDTSNNMGKNTEGDARVSRYDASTESNQYTCRNESDATSSSPCVVTNENDPPQNFVETHLDAFMNSLEDEDEGTAAPFLFFVGDGQTHDETQNNMLMDRVGAIASISETNVNSILARFTDPARVIMTPGNNDGPHNLLFVDTPNDPVNMQASVAWAAPIINKGIVDNSLGRKYAVNGSSGSSDDFVDSVGLFNSTGYYLKELPTGGSSTRVFALVLNDNLGLQNPTQNAAMAADLEWLRSLSLPAAKVFVFGHFPSDTSHGTGMERLSGYEGLVLGTFAGHIHLALHTTPALFTQVPAVSQGGTEDNGYYTFLLDPVNPAPPKMTKKESLVRWAGAAGDIPTQAGWVCCG